MKVIYIPLEDIESRYTVMMNSAIRPHIDIELYPKVKIDKVIKRGQFLDIVNTCKFKAAQLQMIAELFDENKVEDGDVFLVGDIFFPGIESIKYMAELQNINVKVYGFNYAGRADETDFVQKLGEWADYSEAGYHFICDGIFVGSEDHKQNIIKYFDYNPDKIHVTGLIWDLNWMDRMTRQMDFFNKEDYIIWPHRFAPEKGINELLRFARTTDKKIIITSSNPKSDLGIELPDNVEYHAGLSKKRYFELFAKARWYLGTQYQETFGYSISEAIYFNCNILVPDRACCPEMVPERNVYLKLSEIDDLYDNYDLRVPFKWTERWHDNIKLVMQICKGELNSVPENYFKI